MSVTHSRLELSPLAPGMRSRALCLAHGPTPVGSCSRGGGREDTPSPPTWLVTSLELRNVGRGTKTAPSFFLGKFLQRDRSYLRGKTGEAAGFQSQRVQRTASPNWFWGAPGAEPEGPGSTGSHREGHMRTRPHVPSLRDGTFRQAQRPSPGGWVLCRGPVSGGAKGVIVQQCVPACMGWGTLAKAEGH